MSELTNEMIRAALAVKWPALYRDGLFSEHDGPVMRDVTDERIDLIRRQWAAMESARRASTPHPEEKK